MCFLTFRNYTLSLDLKSLNRMFRKALFYLEKAVKACMHIQLLDQPRLRLCF